MNNDQYKITMYMYIYSIYTHTYIYCTYIRYPEFLGGGGARVFTMFDFRSMLGKIVVEYPNRRLVMLHENSKLTAK
jgi:hypothetical protein